MRKFMCLYLNTGGGHRSAARVFEQCIKNSYPKTHVVLEEGLQNKNRISKFVIEKMYQIVCNYFPLAWHFFYWFAGHYLIQWLITTVLRAQMTRYVVKLIQKHNPTDILSFHFLLTPHIVSAIKKVNPNIRFTVMITDPFTATTAWFYERKADCVITSEKLLQFALENVPVQKTQLKVLPYLISEKYHRPPSDSRIVELKEKLDISKNNKVLLITGGGGGLPSISKIVKHLLEKNPHYTILAVCGYDTTSEKYLKKLSKKHPHIDLRIMGFIDNMDEMIQVCDLAIIKAGPATVFELLCAKKPVIISTYLRNQELGNVHFVEEQKVGKYIHNKKEIALYAHELLNNDEKYSEIKDWLEKLTIDTDTRKIADYLYNKE